LWFQGPGSWARYRRRCLSIRERLIGVGPETKGERRRSTICFMIQFATHTHTHNSS
jgi:hypothetical protein